MTWSAIASPMGFLAPCWLLGGPLQCAWQARAEDGGCHQPGALSHRVEQSLSLPSPHQPCPLPPSRPSTPGEIIGPQLARAYLAPIRALPTI